MSIIGNVAGLGAVQPDWAQNDEKKADYIRNKPDILRMETSLEELRVLAGDALPKAGGTMDGGVDMGGNQITGLGTPSSPGDAVTKGYVDSMRFFGEVVLTVGGWSASAPYRQTVSLDSISGSDTPHYGVVYSGVLQTDMARKEAFAKVDDMDAYDGYMVFTCFEEKPEVDIPLQIEVQRSGSDAGQATVLKLTKGLGAEIQAEIESINYGAENATLDSKPTATTFDFTVL